MNLYKIVEICNKYNLQELPAVRQLVKAINSKDEDNALRIGDNIKTFLEENNLIRNSSVPPDRISTIPPNKR